MAFRWLLKSQKTPHSMSMVKCSASVLKLQNHANLPPPHSLLCSSWPCSHCLISHARRFIYWGKKNVTTVVRSIMGYLFHVYPDTSPPSSINNPHWQGQAYWQCWLHTSAFKVCPKYVSPQWCVCIANCLCHQMLSPRSGQLNCLLHLALVLLSPEVMIGSARKLILVAQLICLIHLSAQLMLLNKLNSYKLTLFAQLISSYCLLMLLAQSRRSCWLLSS